MKHHLSSLAFFFFFGITLAQVPKSSELYKTLKANDSLLFDIGFNTCDLSAFENLLAEDLEFYHDKGGITNTKAAFVTSFKNGICGNANFKSRRELLPETLEVFPLYNKGTLYGAVQKGVHRFFESMDGKPETKGSTAMFTHLWLKEETGWKIKRVLSYNHQMIADSDKELKEIKLSKTILQGYVGQYTSPRAGNIDVSYNGTALTVKADKMVLNIVPSSETAFFDKSSALTFEFVTNSEGNTTKFIVFENGKKIEDAIKE